MKNIFFNSLFLLSVTTSGIHAQFEYIKPHDINEIESRRVIVVVEQPEDMVLRKLQKRKKNTDAYKTAINEYNKNFEDAVTQYWKIPKGTVEFKTLEEIKHISDKKNYTVIYCRTAKQSELSDSYLALNGVLWWPDFKEVVRDRDFSGKMTVFGISLLDKFGTFPIYQCPVPDIYPTRADLEYVINAVNNYLMYRDVNKHISAEKIDEQLLKDNQPQLKNKILLLRRDYLEKKLTLPGAIKKAYPYPFMVTSKDTIEKAIDAADSRYAVAIVTPYDLESSGGGAVKYVQYLYSPADGLILGSSGLLDMPSADNSNVLNLKPVITKRCLLDFWMYLKPSVRN